MEDTHVGFLPSQGKIGEEVVSTLTEALWFIDPHRSKLEGRSIRFAEPFQQMKGFNDPKENKKAPPRVSIMILKKHDLYIKTRLTVLITSAFHQ